MTKNRAFVLIHTLIITLIALLMLAGLSYVMFYNIKLSGVSKRYTSALEAARGAALECMKGIQKNCVSFLKTESSFKCNISSDSWPSDSKYTSHSNPQDIINYADWPKTSKKYGDYEVYCKIVSTLIYSGVEGSYKVYALEVVAKKADSAEVAWISVGVKY